MKEIRDLAAFGMRLGLDDEGYWQEVNREVERTCGEQREVMDLKNETTLVEKCKQSMEVLSVYQDKDLIDLQAMSEEKRESIVNRIETFIRRSILTEQNLQNYSIMTNAELIEILSIAEKYIDPTRGVRENGE